MKMMERVAKVLNQAERAPEGSPEREAFMEKAMTLAQAHSIDLAVARAHQAKKERVEVPERRSFKVGVSGLSVAKNAHFVDLMLAICSANDIEVLISQSNTYVHGTGMPSDLDMAERFFSLLSVQMVAEADAQIKAGANTEVRLMPKTRREEIPEDERSWGQHDGGSSYANSCHYDEQWDVPGSERRESDWNKSYPPPKFRNVVVYDDEGNAVMEEKRVSVEDARIWRVNFYQGFVNRTRSRLVDAKRQALREAGIDVASNSDTRGVALRDKAKEVRDTFESDPMYVLATSSGGSYNGAEVSRHSHGGNLAGDEAGKRAVLGTERVVE